MMMKMTDDEAFEFYADPVNQQPGERAPTRSRAKLSGHVPVRFAEDTISQVRALADHDGVTVSTWIRQVVTREIERRVPSMSVGWAIDVAWTVDGETSPIRTEGVKQELAGTTAS